MISYYSKTAILGPKAVSSQGSGAEFTGSENFSSFCTTPWLRSWPRIPGSIPWGNASSASAPFLDWTKGRGHRLPEKLEAGAPATQGRPRGCLLLKRSAGSRKRWGVECLNLVPGLSLCRESYLFQRTVNPTVLSPE